MAVAGTAVLMLVLNLVLVLASIPLATALARNAICTVTNAVGRSLDRTFDVGGIYFRLLPSGAYTCDRFSPADVMFKVFPYKSLHAPHELLRPEHSAERLLSFFDPEKPTFVYTHGFFEGEGGASSRAFKAAFLHRGDYNFISVDWQKLSSGPWYPTAASNVLPVGLELARLLDRLIYIGAIRRDTLHLAGFSLGAHVSGVASHHLTAGRVPRITGLDPAAPLFTDRPLSERLDTGDADFVDVIHTGGGLYGFSDPIGHVDFFPNGGRFVQPGCLIIASFGACSHWRAWRFFEESLRGGEFVATSCGNWPDFASGRCKGNQINLMGLHTDLTARGSFYLRTNWIAPFSVF